MTEKQFLAEVRSSRIIVVGDIMLDHYVHGTVTRISPEAPVPVVKMDHEEFTLGGAANVALNLATLGVQTALVGAIGKDEEGSRIVRMLLGAGIDAPLRVCKDGPTTVKKRIVAGQQIVRIDREKVFKRTLSQDNAVIKAIRDVALTPHAIIVSDYAKGVVSQYLMTTLSSLCKDLGTKMAINLKPGGQLDTSNMWGRCSLVTVNRREAFAITKCEDAGTMGSLVLAARRLQVNFGNAIVVVTLGDDGMFVLSPGRAGADPCWKHIRTEAKEVADVSGAGDTVIAVFTAALTCGASVEEAARLANKAAGIVVAKAGTAVVYPKEMIS